MIIYTNTKRQNKSKNSAAEEEREKWNKTSKNSRTNNNITGTLMPECMQQLQHQHQETKKMNNNWQQTHTRTQMKNTPENAIKNFRWKNGQGSECD